jgi:hypothetical protein
MGGENTEVETSLWNKRCQCPGDFTKLILLNPDMVTDQMLVLPLLLQQ